MTQKRESKEREKERDRDRESTETERERQRQRDRQTETETETDRQTETRRHRQTETEKGAEAEFWNTGGYKTTIKQNPSNSNNKKHVQSDLAKGRENISGNQWKKKKRQLYFRTLVVNFASDYD